MAKTDHHHKMSLPIANKPYHCSKVKCHRSLPLNHPIQYTNNLCERHFFSIDLSSSDDDDDDNNNNNNNLTNESKLSLEKKQIYSTKNQYQSLRGDIRKTREIFDGHQWYIIEQIIDHASSIDNKLVDLTTKNDNEEILLKILRLLSSYKTIEDELKKQ